jgi:hypothetical protein
VLNSAPQNEDVWRSGGIALYIPNFSIDRSELLASCPQLPLGKKPWYPLEK